MSVLRMSRRMVKLSALPAARLRWFLRPACGIRQTLRMAGTAVQRAGEHQNSVHNIGAGAGAQDMDLAAWSRLKNSELGEAISPRLTKIGAWRPDPQPKFQVNEVSGLTPGVPAAVVQGVLSEQECKELIAGFPSGGQGFMPGQRVAELYRDRKVKSRSLVNDELLARILQERLREVLPQQLDGGRLFSVNPNFRFVHYDTGGRHSTHIDGREPVMPRWDEAAEGWVQSRLTMQIYLNSHGKDFEGGEFAIVDADDNGEDVQVKHVIKPQAGDVVLFYQERLNPPSDYPPYELQHQGNDVTAGQKFACRTMVDYIFPNEEVAHFSNVKDDYMAKNADKMSVLAIGNTIMDTVLTVSHIPVDEKIHVETKKTYVGGQGANAAQALALLGAKVSFMTRIGDDAEGTTAVTAYKKLGMDLAHVICVPGAHTSVAAGAHTSVAAVLVATDKEKHRSCLIYDDPRLLEPCSAEALNTAIQRLSSGDFHAVYTDGWQIDLALPIARAAQKLSIPILADVEVVNAETRELADLATVVIASVPIIKALAGKDDLRAAVLALANRPGRVIVATEGEKGSHGVAYFEEIVHVPAMDVDVHDTTGAGDSFHAGYLMAFLKRQGVADCMSFATKVAAAKCETPGSSVTHEALERFGLLDRQQRAQVTVS